MLVHGKANYKAISGFANPVNPDLFHLSFANLIQSNLLEEIVPETSMTAMDLAMKEEADMAAKEGFMTPAERNKLKKRLASERATDQDDQTEFVSVRSSNPPLTKIYIFSRYNCQINFFLLEI